MARKKNTRPEWFKMWRRSRQQIDIDEIDLESRGRIFTNILRYFDTGESELMPMSLPEKILFNDFRISVDDSYAEWHHKSETGRENVSKRWEYTAVYDGIPLYTDDTEDRSKRTEDRGQKAEDRGEKEEDRRKKPHKDIFSEFAGEDAELLEALRAFEEMRKKSKRALTDPARKMALDKLQTFPRDKWIPILNQSTFHSWQSLYPLKEEKQTPKEPDMSWRNDVYTGEEYGEEFYNPG